MRCWAAYTYFLVGHTVISSTCTRYPAAAVRMDYHRWYNAIRVVLGCVGTVFRAQLTIFCLYGKKIVKELSQRFLLMLQITFFCFFFGRNFQVVKSAMLAAWRHLLVEY